MRSLLSWIILQSHKAKPLSFYKSQDKEQWELRKLAALRDMGSTWNPRSLVLISLLIQSHCSSPSLSPFYLPSTLLTSLIHILHLQLPFTPIATLTNISKHYSLLPYHLSHLQSAFMKVPLGKAHPPVLLWHCTVTTDPVASLPLISALLSIYPIHTAGAFPAAALLPSAPAGKRSVVCEQRMALLLPLKSRGWLQALWKLNLPQNKSETPSPNWRGGKHHHISKRQKQPAKRCFPVHLSDPLSDICLTLCGLW